MDFNTPDYIEITGADLAQVAKQAYALSRPQGMGFLHARDGGLSDDDAKKLVEQRAGNSIPLSLDYVHGRAVKLTVYRSDDDRLYLRSQWYDHTRADLDALVTSIKPPAQTAA